LKRCGKKGASQSKTKKVRADGRYVATYKGKCFYGHTPEEADKKRTEYKERIERGLDPNRERIADYAVDWLPINKHGVAVKTYELYEHFVHILIDAVGDKTFPEVKPSDIKRIYSERFKGMSDSHIRHFRNLITSIFDSAVEDGYVGWNVCRSKKAKPHKGTADTHRAITEQERDLIRRVPARVQPVAMAMLYAGLRDGEALALNVGRDVDFEAGVIHVRHFRHCDHNIATVSTVGKTPAAKRDVPLFPELEEVIKDIPGLLISGRDGTVLTTSAWRNAWRTYKNTIEREMNGCRKRWYGKRKCDAEKNQHPPPWKEFTVRPYDLRHSFCTWCRDAPGGGVDMHVLQGWMGHSDIGMIAQIYDHVSEDRVSKEVEKLKKSAENSQNPGQDFPESPSNP
jgi:integrase